MFLDGDPEDEQPELELEEVDPDETDEPADEDEDETEDEQPEPEADEDPLPDDPAELKRIARERGKAAKEAGELAKRFEAIAVGGKKDTPQTPAKKAEDEDEFQPHLNEAYAALVNSEDPDPKAMKKALLALTGVVLNTRKQRAADREADRQERERARIDAAVEKQIPTKYKAAVDEFVEKFGTNKAVAWQMIKGQLYDAAQERARQKKAKPETRETPPARGTATGTAMRPVPPRRDGGSGNMLTLSSGLKIRADHTPESYAKLMDTLESEGKTADRREILRLRNADKVSVRPRA